MAWPPDTDTEVPPGPADEPPPAPGRCIYCGERCEAQATFHHFCRYEHEMEIADKSAHAVARFGDGRD